MKAPWKTCYFVFTLGQVACTAQDQATPTLVPEAVSSVTPGAYDFRSPVARFELDEELDEISGIAWLGEGLLGAVQDEKGLLFLLRIADGTVVRQIRFGEKGDYEGLERLGDSLYVIRSDGRIFSMPVPAEEDPTVTSNERDTGLTARHNAEGIAYDPQTDRLLVVCKDDPGEGLGRGRAIYAYDRRARSMDPEPHYFIDLDTLEAHLREPGAGPGLRIRKGKSRKAADFRPSALEVHPKTGRLWVLSSALKVLVEVDRDGAIVQVHPLPEEQLLQPEGLAFDPDGTLYVASERGKGGAHAVLQVYRPAPEHPEAPTETPPGSPGTGPTGG